MALHGDAVSYYLNLFIKILPCSEGKTRLDDWSDIRRITVAALVCLVSLFYKIMKIKINYCFTEKKM